MFVLFLLVCIKDELADALEFNLFDWLLFALLADEDEDNEETDSFEWVWTCRRDAGGNERGGGGGGGGAGAAAGDEGKLNLDTFFDNFWLFIEYSLLVFLLLSLE